jgi:hypothetical protein
MEVRFGETPKPAREPRALPGICGRHSPSQKAMAWQAAASTRLRQGYGVPSSQDSAAFLMLFGTLEEFSIRA